MSTPEPGGAVKPRPQPRIGQRYTLRGVSCEIVAVHPFGTIDVVEIDGPGAWRVSGLWPVGAS